MVKMVHFIPPSQRKLAMLAAQADSSPVLICGSSGTGKSAIAKWIHSTGVRSGRVFLVANRKKSLTSQLIEAQGGTLMIEEIGEWSLSEQKVLTEYFSSKCILHPDGSGTKMLLNVRVICTSSQVLEGRAEASLFNPELLHDLNFFKIKMPPLEKRSDEFEDIVLGIAGEVARELHKEYLLNKDGGLSEEAWENLRSYDWPGNIRELRNVIRIGVTQAKGDRLEASDFPAFGHDRVDFRATREQFEKIYLSELFKTFHGDFAQITKAAGIEEAILKSKLSQYGIM